MQAIAPVTHNDFLRQYQEPLEKVEIFYECCWVDLTDFLDENRVKDVSMSPTGASLMPEPKAASASFTIDNSDGIFDPNSTDPDPYCEYFKVGRRVKIQVGAKYGGVDYYWRRFYGFMEEPNFTIGKGGGEIQINCFDNMRFLADTKFKMPDNYWGSSQLFSTGDPGGTLGPELYAENDAMEIGGGEANNVANWVPTDCTFVSFADVGGGSTWVGKANTTAMEADVENPDVGTVVGGSTYKVTLKYRRMAGSTLPMKAGIYQVIGGNDISCGSSGNLNAAVWTEASFYFTALTSGVIKMKFLFYDTAQEYRIDEISIKLYTDATEYRYELPAGATGVHFAELDEGEGFQRVPYGVKDEGWRYDEENRYFYFDEGRQVEQGTDNLRVYYFAAQSLDNVVADLLVRAGLYDTRAEALAAMIYTPTGITIDRVWFDKGTSVLNAMTRCCERCNYRFYFNYAGRPVFQPAPTSPRMLTDGNFEVWTDANDLTYWTEGTAGASTINRENTDKIKGDFSCRFDVDVGNNVCTLHQHFSMTPEQRHRIVIWYRNSIAGKTADFYIRDDGINVYLKPDGTWQAGAMRIPLPSSVTWAKFNLVFYAHADYGDYQLWLSKDAAASSSIYFDDVEIWKEDFSFDAVGDIADLSEKQDKSEIRNRIIIEGEKQDQLQEKDAARPSELKGEAFELASIHKYGEHTHTIENQLFQDQATIDTYCAIYLAAFKDPKWYSPFNAPFNPVPLELGDTAMWKKQYQAGHVIKDQWGLIRSIEIDNHSIGYTIEKA